MSFYLNEKNLALHITSHCNLNCKLCAALIPYGRLKHALKHVPLEQIKNDIDMIFAIYNHIEEFVVSGGEPFLHPSLPEVIKYCMHYQQQFNRLRIFTNGSLYPSQDLIEIFHQFPQKIGLVVDYYDPILSCKASIIDDKQQLLKIPVHINKYHGADQHCGGWVSLGDPRQKRDSTPAENAAKFSKCHSAQYKCLTVFNGKLANCATSLFAYEFNCHSITQQFVEQDFISLNKDTDIEKLQLRASKFGKQVLQACAYCNGFDVETSERFPAGEQLKLQ